MKFTVILSDGTERQLVSAGNEIAVTIYISNEQLNEASLIHGRDADGLSKNSTDY